MQEEIKCVYFGRGLEKDLAEIYNSDPEKNAQMRKWQQEMIQQYGFYIHYVTSRCDIYVDCHTHGLLQSLDHPELQIIIPIPGNYAGCILHNVVDKIKEGHHLVDKEKIDKIITNWPVLVSKMKNEENETYFRIIFPDKNGLFPDDDNCDKILKNQEREDLLWKKEEENING